MEETIINRLKAASGLRQKNLNDVDIMLKS
jgi:hypothetical protein